MRKKVRFYRQHTMQTCGISCILMLLDLYGKVQYPTPKQESKLYENYRSWAYMGVTAAAAADCLSQNNLSVRLLQSSRQYMDNRDGYFDEDLFSALLEEYTARLRSCESRIVCETGVDFTCTDLKEYLAEGKQIMLQCFIPGDADGIHSEVLHWVLLYGYEDGAFLVCDPLCSKIRLTDAQITHYMDTPIGKICIITGSGD